MAEALNETNERFQAEEQTIRMIFPKKKFREARATDIIKSGEVSRRELATEETNLLKEKKSV